MLSEFPVDRRRKKTALILGATVSPGYGAYVLLTSPPTHVPAFVILGLLVIANAGIVYYAWPAPHGFTVRAGRRNGGSPGPALDSEVLSAPPTAASGRPVLRAVAWLMPRAAARRWLAEVESLLFELPAGRRARAVRSYVLCAPRLAMMMWTRHLSSRTNRRA